MHPTKSGMRRQVAAVEPSDSYSTFPMRVDTPPYDNNDLRLAIKYAFNRKDALQRILHGHGSLDNDHPISSVNRYGVQRRESWRPHGCGLASWAPINCGALWGIDESQTESVSYAADFARWDVAGQMLELMLAHCAAESPQAKIRRTEHGQRY